MTTAVEADIRAAARRIAEANREPDWLRDLRARAAEAYVAAPLPLRAVHLWRFTDPLRFVPALEALEARPAGDASSAPPAGGDPVSALVRGGRVERIALDPVAEKAGIRLLDLREAAARHPDLVRPHLGAILGTEAGKFEALNLAAWEAGLFLHIPKDVNLAVPLRLVREAAPAPAWTGWRLLVVAEAGASATVIDELAGGRGSGASVNGAAEVVVGDGADVRIVAVQRFDPEAVALEARRARLGRDARYLHVQASLGAGLAKTHLGSEIAGRGAEVGFVGVAVADGTRHLDHHTAHDHAAPDARSDIRLRVVLRGKARSVYTGRIRVETSAVNTDAYQENRNLILDPAAKTESIPELEILTDAVKCSHGATMGPVDPEQIHYLMSRGIPREAAERLIVAGFVEPALEAMPESLRDRVRAALGERLGLEA
jgi:Fe-S cluster assembly protein SufD